jgi:hypothetical protein
MPPPTPPRWTETRLGGLVPTEHDTQEFKSSLFVVDQDGGIRSDFLDALSKQVSAFANGAGGHLFLGIDDQGAIDGGVPTGLRSNGTREWLEDVVPGLVEPPLKDFNVFEVGPEGEASAIGLGRAVYVLAIPESEDAPHMSRDRRYYLRIAGKSRPMGHRNVLDIMGRRHDPEVRFHRIDPYGEPEHVSTDPRGPKVLLQLRGTLVNEGRALAHHVGCEFVLPRFAVNSVCRQRTLSAHQNASLSQRPGEVTYFVYHPTPVFPQQELVFGNIWIAIHSSNLHHYRAGRVILRWRVYADAATRQEGQVDVSAFSALKRGIRLLRRHESTRTERVSD